MPYGPGRLAPQIIAVHGHVQRTHRNPDAFHFVHHRCEPMSQRDTASGNPHQHQSLGAAIRLENLVGHPSACAGDLISVEDHT
jgi:hypothetical protein